MKVRSGQDPFTHLSLWQQLHFVKPNFLIVEQFEFRHGSRAAHGLDMYPKELIGVCELYCQLSNVAGDAPCILKMQTPGYALGSMFHDNRLKEDGLYKPLKGGHANDAVRHLLMWFVSGSGFQFNSEGYEPQL